MKHSPTNALALLMATLAVPWIADAQELKRGSDNIEVVSHIPLGGPLSVSDIDIEQELSRPYVYVSRMFLECSRRGSMSST
jgi:hypothetical protein